MHPRYPVMRGCYCSTHYVRQVPGDEGDDEEEHEHLGNHFQLVHRHGRCPATAAPQASQHLHLLSSWKRPWHKHGLDFGLPALAEESVVNQNVEYDDQEGDADTEQ